MKLKTIQIIYIDTQINSKAKDLIYPSTDGFQLTANFGMMLRFNRPSRDQWGTLFALIRWSRTSKSNPKMSWPWKMKKNLWKTVSPIIHQTDSTPSTRLALSPRNLHKLNQSRHIVSHSRMLRWNCFQHIFTYQDFRYTIEKIEKISPFCATCYATLCKTDFLQLKNNLKLFFTNNTIFL